MPNKAKHLQKDWKDISWSIKGPLLVAALLLGFFEDSLHLGRALFTAAVAMVVPMIGFRAYWNQTRFWITVALLAAIQVGLIFGVSSMMKLLKFFPFMLAFGIADCVLVALAISSACCAHD